VNLERCPYDSSPIAVEVVDRLTVISCAACGAAWEMRGTSLRRLRVPDPATMAAVREGLFSQEVVRGKRAAAGTGDAAR
jgi:hypothetical protein